MPVTSPSRRSDWYSAGEMPEADTPALIRAALKALAPQE